MKLEFSRLDSTNTKDILSLYRRSEDYFILGEGTIPDSCDELLYDLPPNVKLDQKVIVGAFQEDQLVGLVDCLLSFPEQDTSMIGLLLVDSGCRGMGIGANLFQHVVDLSKEKRMKRIRIGVMESNQGALKFWSRMGFVHVDTKGPVTYGERTHMIHVMINELML